VERDDTPAVPRSALAEERERGIGTGWVPDEEPRIRRERRAAAAAVAVEDELAFWMALASIFCIRGLVAVKRLGGGLVDAVAAELPSTVRDCGLKPDG